MKREIKEFKAYVKSINKISKIIILAGTPLIFALLFGGIFLEIFMLINGYRSQTDVLINELIKCCGDCISAIYIPALVIDFLIRS